MVLQKYLVTKVLSYLQKGTATMLQSVTSYSSEVTTPRLLVRQYYKEKYDKCLCNWSTEIKVLKSCCSAINQEDTKEDKDNWAHDASFVAVVAVGEKAHLWCMTALCIVNDSIQ